MIGRVVRALLGEEVESPEPLPPGVRLRCVRWIPTVGGRLSGMRAPAAAVTLGRTIVVHPRTRLTPRLLRHELAHVEQWRRHPVAFPLLYAVNHLRHGYGSNPYEVEARHAERCGGGGQETGAADPDWRQS